MINCFYLALTKVTADVIKNQQKKLGLGFSQ